jgi:hypothetical protein
LLWLFWRWESHELSARLALNPILLISASQVARIRGMSHQGTQLKIILRNSDDSLLENYLQVPSNVLPHTSQNLSILYRSLLSCSLSSIQSYSSLNHVMF